MQHLCYTVLLLYCIVYGITKIVYTHSAQTQISILWIFLFSEYFWSTVGWIHTFETCRYRGPTVGRRHCEYSRHYFCPQGAYIWACGLNISPVFMSGNVLTETFFTLKLKNCFQRLERYESYLQAKISILIYELHNSSQINLQK